MSVSLSLPSSAAIAHTKEALPRWFIPVLGGLVIEVFFLIALGGAVRIMNAGLACPDWPLCFGDYIPDYHPQVYFEFIHRAMAGLVAVMTVVLTLTAWTRRVPSRVFGLLLASLVLLLAQIVFGGLTVLLQLQAGVVAAHLGLGTAFFALLLWIYLDLKHGASQLWRLGLPVVVKGISFYLPIVIYAQILLGGLVASHYAALVCLDFPTCQGQWFPTFHGMIGLHVIHRLGAYFVFFSALVCWQVGKHLARKESSERLKPWLSLLRSIFFVVCGQVILGIANVLLRTPALIGVAHLATATFALSLAVRLFHTHQLMDCRTESL